MRFFWGMTAAIMAAVPAGTALADAADGQAYFSVMGTYIDDDEDRNIEDGINGGQFGFGYGLNEAWNIEALFQGARGEGPIDHSYSGIGVDMQRVFRRAERFSPYLQVGVGYFMDDPAGADSNDGAMYSGGLGFYLDLFSTNLALRGEWRYRVDSAGPENLSDNLVSVGLQLPFGEAEPAFVDSDGDGVSDGMDRCPNTPAGSQVDAYGCELDSDGDSVVDRLDECPNTAPGDPVDRRGCTLRGEYVLEGTAFEYNSDRLTQEARDILDGAVETLNRYPELRFEIGGHTDNTGSPEYNEGLSERRARAVHDYFASKGIDESRMTVRGYGEESPIATNDTDAGRAANRRVSLRVIEE